MIRVALLADITTLDVDAVVNAANEQLLPGGGVCAKLGGCPTGEARITPGFALRSRFVIHAVGPVWYGGNEGEPEILAGAYHVALTLARDHGCGSFAFPAISTGIYGYPLGKATAVAVSTVDAFAAEAGALERVVFACFGEDALRASREAGVEVVRVDGP